MGPSDTTAALRAHLLAGQVIPAHPLALDERRRLDEPHQRALTRYYLASGAGGVAVGVHTTQFAIREHWMYEPVLKLASEIVDSDLVRCPRPFVKVAGIVGQTRHAIREARIALDAGYDTGLLSLAAWRGESEDAVLEHCRAFAEAIPLFGFYLQPAVGGRVLSYEFWRAFSEIPQLVAIKIAPFDRYQTLEVTRAVADAGRSDVALYTGNDDHIIGDLLERQPGSAIVGGLLGQWAMWTSKAVALVERLRGRAPSDAGLRELLAEAPSLTDANGAIFDAANGFAGCIPGIHEVLRRQGLVDGIWCLDPNETLSPGQLEEIDRVLDAYPFLQDDDFVAQHLDEWLR
ncbi:MAG: dihydrodipicolinate synthase family protein [Gemmatimonadaceae bacterium]